MKSRLSSLLTMFVVLITGLLLSISTAVSEDIKPEIQQAFDNADTSLALTLLQKEIDFDRSYHLSYYWIGRVHFARQQWQQAQEQFETALDKKSKHYESLYYLGRTQTILGDLEGATKSMEKGIKKGKKLAHMFHNGMGLILMEQGDFDQAAKSFLKAILDDENNAEYHINLGDAYFRQEVPSLAAGEYEKAQGLDTAGTEVYFHWAEACLEMKDYNCAIEKLQIVLTKDSTYAPAWSRAGEIYFKAAMSARSRADREARFRDVIGSYRRYFDISGAQPDSSTVRAYFELGLAYVNVRGYEDGDEYLGKVLAIPYEPKDIYFYLGKSKVRTKDYIGGADLLLKHIDWASQQGDEYTTRVSDLELYMLLGDAYYYRENKDFYNAVKYYLLSLDENSDQKRLVQNVAFAYHNIKDYAKAIEYYQKRVDMGIDSTGARLLKNAAYCAINLAGNGEEEEDDMLDEEEDGEEVVAVSSESTIDYLPVAVDYMNQYLEYEPEDEQVLLRIATVYLFQMKDCANGIKYFERLLAVDPENCDAKRSIGFAYFGGGICSKNYSKALTYLRQAYNCITAASGACEDVDLVLWIAQCYHTRAAENTTDREAQKGDYKNAKDWYSKVLKCDPNNAEAKKGIEQTIYEF